MVKTIKIIYDVSLNADMIIINNFIFNELLKNHRKKSSINLIVISKKLDKDYCGGDDNH